MSADPDTIAFISRHQPTTTTENPLSEAVEKYARTMRRIHSNVYTSQFYYTFNSVAGKIYLNDSLQKDRWYAEYIIRMYYMLFTDMPPSVQDIEKIMSSFC